MSKMVGVKRSAETGDSKISKKAKFQTKDGSFQSKPKSFGAPKKSFSHVDKDLASGQAGDVGTQDSNNVHPSRQGGQDGILNGNSSRESHQKQKALVQERKAAKPNADSIARSKKLWEQLRRKSHVPKEERDKLVAELFDIITGRVKEFVFKHDSVRVIQCALKYASPEQRRLIVQELRGSYRELAESRYAKFLIAKMIVEDNEIRDMIVPEFYGHVKRLVRHPEASWIVDDIYRGLATKQQKARLLREWYGTEFVVFGKEQDGVEVTGDLAEILKANPEKRGPIMSHLKEMTNQLVQKKTTGFTMLHDALLQYFLNCKPGSSEQTEFLEMLRDDEEGDLFKNMAFTKSGSRLVCLALAYGNSKDRRSIMKFFKTHIKLLASDVNGHLVLLTAYEVIDDTVMSGKAIFPELFSKDLDSEARDQENLNMATDLTARISMLFVLAPQPAKWLLTDSDVALLTEIREIRKTTSKKEAETRRIELVKTASQPLLDFIASQAQELVKSSFGCQFITEVLFGAIGDKTAALEALASLAGDHSIVTEFLGTPHAGRMLKSLVQGGRFDQITKTIQLCDPPLKFSDLLYERLSNQESGVLSWATGSNSFTVVAMLEAVDFSHRTELEEKLKSHRDELKDTPEDDKAASAGASILLEKIGHGPVAKKEKVKKSKSKSNP